VVAAGQTLSIDCGAFTASKAGSSVLSNITHNSAYTRWLIIPRGTNNVTVSGDGISNSPVLTVTFSAPYF
jgi:hypothetical protein